VQYATARTPLWRISSRHSSRLRSRWLTPWGDMPTAGPFERSTSARTGDARGMVGTARVSSTPRARPRSVVSRSRLHGVSARERWTRVCVFTSSRRARSAAEWSSRPTRSPSRATTTEIESARHAHSGSHLSVHVAVILPVRKNSSAIFCAASRLRMTLCGSVPLSRGGRFSFGASAVFVSNSTMPEPS